MNSAEYWAKVARDRMDDIHRGSTPYIQGIHDAYDQALADIEGDIKRTFNKFAVDGKLTPAEAKKLLTAVESKAVLDGLRAKIHSITDEDLKRELLNRVNAPAYAARLTRMNAIREKIYVECKALGADEIKKSRASYLNSMDDAYYRKVFDLQRQVGYAFDFGVLSPELIDQLMMHRFKGARFSERVWKNTDIVAGRLQGILTSGVMSGRSYEQMARDMEEFTDFGKYAATRLVRTETTYITNQADLLAYREAGVDRYEYLATLDGRTSEMCQDMDGKIIEISKAEPGVNLPPLHPNCRSTTVAHFDDAPVGKRRARDVNGDPMLVDGDMAYYEWRQLVVGDNGPKLNQFKGLYQKWEKSKKPIKSFAQALVDGEGISLKVNRHKLQAMGQCRIQLTSDINITSYELNSDDIRENPYQIKTAFHELYHAKANGLPHGISYGGPYQFNEWAYVDDVFAESTAHYITKATGVSNELAPAYAGHLVSTLPKLKSIPEFSACKTIADFGEVAFEYRFGKNTNADWSQLYQMLQTTPYDIITYSKSYIPYISTNKAELVDKLLENMPKYKPFKSNMVADIENAIDIINNGRTLSGNEKMVFENALIITMNRLGVK